MDADKVDFQNNHDPYTFDSDYKSLKPSVMVLLQLSSKKEKIITEIEKKYLGAEYKSALKMHTDEDFEKEFQEFKYLSDKGYKNLSIFYIPFKLKYLV